MGFLSIFTRFIGQRGAGIIQRKGVVAVINIGVHIRQFYVRLSIGLPG